MINKGTIDNSPTKSGNNTFTGTNTFTKSIVGNLTGTATNANSDSDGHQIKTYYAKVASANTFSGNNTFTGTNTFTKTISGSINGNAATVTNGVYTTGDQTIGGTKTFSKTISGSIDGNAATVTNGVYTTGNQTIGGTKTFSTNVYMETSGTSGRFYSKNTALDLTNTSRENDIGIGYRSVDKNDNIAGEFTNVFSTAGTSYAVMQVRNRASGSQVTSQIRIAIDKNGNISTECPTPTSATDNTGKIATTAWVNNFLDSSTTKGTITGYCVPNYDSAVTITSPYTPTKNGIIIAKSTSVYSTCEIAKGTTTISRANCTDATSGTNAVWAIVKSGEQYTVTATGTATLLFVPFVGA